MVDTALITAGGIVAAIIAAAAYSHYTGNEASVDTDNDGEDELTFGNAEDDSDGGETAVDADESSEESDGIEDEIAASLTDITGVGPTKADALRDIGLERPKDVYYTSDENVTEATGIGSGVLQQIRDDIGGIDHDTDSGSDEDE